MANMRVLVSYKDQNEVVTLEKIKVQELVAISRHRFQIPVTKLIKFQRYDAEWDADVNVEVREVRDKDRLKIVLVDSAAPLVVSLDSSSFSESDSEKSMFSSLVANNESFPEVLSVTEPGVFEPVAYCQPSTAHGADSAENMPLTKPETSDDKSHYEDQTSSSSSENQLSLSSR